MVYAIVYLNAVNFHYQSREELQQIVQNNGAVGTATEEELTDFIRPFHPSYVPMREGQEKRRALQQRMANKVISISERFLDPAKQQEITEYLKVKDKEKDAYKEAFDKQLAEEKKKAEQNAKEGDDKKTDEQKKEELEAAAEKALEQQNVKNVHQPNRVFDPILMYYKDNPQKYKELYEIFSGTDKEAWAREYLAFWDFLTKENDLEELIHMNDEQLVDHCENIIYLEQMLGQFDAIFGIGTSDNTNTFKGKTMFPLSEDRCTQMLGMWNQYKYAIDLLDTKLNVIFEPYYVQFPPESLPYMDKAGWDTALRLDEKLFADVPRTFQTYIDRCDTYLSELCLNWQQELLRGELKGINKDEMSWFDIDGKEFRETDNTKPAKPPLDYLRTGNPLIAQFPNGVRKAYFIEVENGNAKLVHGDSRRIAKHLNESIPGKLQKLVKGLKDADPWYVRSSQEFKDVKEMLEKVQEELQKLDKIPTDYQRKKLFQQMFDLEDTCAKYLMVKKESLKQKGRKANDLETSRMQAVEDIQKFANGKLEMLYTLDDRMELENKTLNQKKAQYAKELETAREKRQKDIEKQLDELRDYKGNLLPDKNELLEMVSDFGMADLSTLRQYAMSPGPNNRFYQNTPLVEKLADTFYKARQDLMKALDDSYNPKSRTIPWNMHEKISQSMAEMTAISMLRHEAGNSDGEKAQSLFELYEKDPKEFVLEVMSDPVFRKAMGNITPKSIADFCLQDQFTELGYTMAREMPKRLEREAKEEAERRKQEEERKQREEEFEANKPTVRDRISSYISMNIPNSDKCSLVNTMKNQVAMTMSVLDNNGDRGYLGLPENEVRRNLAKMTALELILLERGDQKENIKAGQAEISLQEQGIEKFAEAIEQHPLFQKETQTLTPETYMDFVISNKSKKVGGEIFAEAIERSRQLSQNKKVQNNETYLDDRKLTEEHKKAPDKTQSKLQKK